MLDRLRNDFPVLDKKIIYFDSACMSLKPRQVIEAMSSYYNEFSACGGRSEHKLARKVTEEMERSREKIKKFINARKSEEIVFNKNTTEGINFIANSLDLKNGLVLTTDREHNSNLLPWIRLNKDGKIKHEIVKSKDNFEFDLENFSKKVKNAKLVSFVHTSNLDGYTLPVKEIIKIAHENDALVLLDGAQSVPHKEIDVKKLDVDFLAFSGHKMLGPNGVGVLYGKEDLLKELKPFIIGGETVIDSTYDDFKLEKIPNRFEAGLQNYSGIIGLGAAVDYLSKIGMNKIMEHELKLNKKLSLSLKEFEKFEIIGVKDFNLRGSILSFRIKGISIHEVAHMLDQHNIMIRSGAHCVHSWFNAHHLDGSCRVSLYLYNNEEECETFLETIKKIVRLVK